MQRKEEQLLMSEVGKPTKQRSAKSGKDRKRAVYSCDRCKKKKIKCQREISGQLTFDNATTCTQCITANVECYTTVPRKKRKYYSVSESSRTQLKCLVVLFKALYPGHNPNNLDHLKAISRDLKIKLPYSSVEVEGEPKSCTATELYEEDNKRNEIDLLNGETWKNEDISSSDEEAFPRESPENAGSYGLRGTSGLLTSVLELRKPESSTNVDADAIAQNLTLPDENDSKSSKKLLLQSFLIYDKLSKHDAHLFVDSFFENVHPSYLILDEVQIRRQNEFFFDELKNSKLYLSTLWKQNEVDIACIYLVWILGRSFNESLAQPDSNDFSVDCFSIVKLLAGNTITNLSLGGIRLLYLLAIYFDSKRKREVAWQLLGLASQQCISLGYTRKSTIGDNPGEPLEKKVVWWSIFKLQMNMNSSLGKTPSIEIGAIDIGSPDLSNMYDQLFSDYFSSSIDLFKIMYHILKHRKKLYVSNQPLARQNVERTAKLGHALKQWYNGISLELRQYKETVPVKRFQIKLHLQYCYLYISLTLPYLLYLSRNWKSLNLSQSTCLIDVLCEGIKVTENLCEIINYSDQTNQFNGLLHYDMFYAYNSIMVLILSFALLKGQDADIRAVSNQKFFEDSFLKQGGTLSSIISAMKLVYRVNKRNAKYAKGLMKEASNNIELLIIHFGLTEILKRKSAEDKLPQEISTESHQRSNSMDDTSVPLSPDNTSFHERYLILRSRYSSSGNTNHPADNMALSDIEFFNMEQNPLLDSYFLTFCDEVTSRGFIAR